MFRTHVTAVFVAAIEEMQWAKEWLGDQFVPKALVLALLFADFAALFWWTTAQLWSTLVFAENENLGMLTFVLAVGCSISSLILVVLLLDSLAVWLVENIAGYKKYPGMRS